MYIFQYVVFKLKVEVVQILLEVGGDFNILDGVGGILMINVICQCVRVDGIICIDDCLIIVLMLFYVGSDVNMIICEECCLFMVVLILRCLILVKFFLDYGVNFGI